MNQDEVFSKLSEEIEIRQVGKWKRGLIFGLIARNRWYFYVTSYAGGKKFKFTSYRFVNEGLNPNEHLRRYLASEADRVADIFTRPWTENTGKIEHTQTHSTKTGQLVTR